MILVSIYAFGLALAIYLECLLRKKDLFSPERLYLFFHAIAFGVAFLALDKAMTPFRTFTSLIYFGSAVSFVLGVWAAKLLARGEVTSAKPDFSGYNWTVHLVFTYVLFFIFVAGMLTARAGIGGFPVFMENQGRAIKLFFGYFHPASVALSYGGIVALMFFISIFRPRKGSILRVPEFWMTIGTTVFYFFALSRNGIVFFLFAGLFFFHYAIRKLSILKLSFFFSLFALLVIITGYQKAFSIQERYGLKREKVLEYAFMVPYLYFANNYWNLDYALNPDNHRPGHGHTYGFVAVSGILDFIYLPGGFLGWDIRESYGWDNQFNQTSSKVRGLNSVSYQWALYKDFGIPGALGGPFVLGGLLGWLYAMVRRRPTLTNIATYSFLGYFVALSMFSFYLESSIYVYGLFYLTGSLWLARRLAQKHPDDGEKALSV